MFYEIEKRHARRTVARALDGTLAMTPTDRELMSLFVESLRKVTGDVNAGDWIPEEVLGPEIIWDESRYVEDDFFINLKTTADETGVVLHYDDGTAEGALDDWDGSTVLFRKPEGQWAVDRLAVLGSRTGTAEPSEQDFLVHVCDEDFDRLARTACPDTLSEAGEYRRNDIPTAPVEVPERFYVCLALNLEAPVVAIFCDESVSQTHSRQAQPYWYVLSGRADAKYDWMIRAHLLKAGGQQ